MSKFFQFHALFGKICSQSVCWRPWRLGAPTFGKFWIRHCLPRETPRQSKHHIFVHLTICRGKGSRSAFTRERNSTALRRDEDYLGSLWYPSPLQLFDSSRSQLTGRKRFPSLLDRADDILRRGQRGTSTTSFSDPLRRGRQSIPYFRAARRYSSDAGTYYPNFKF